MKALVFLLSLLCTTSIFASLSLSSPVAHGVNTPLPMQYTCAGKNISPPLSWGGASKDTKSMALFMSDPDAPSGTFYHWIIYNLPPTITALPENMQTWPKGTIVGNNSWGNNKYQGPCPPPGQLHHYSFVIYALDAPLSLPANATGPQVLDAIQTHMLESASLAFTFSH